MNDLGNNPLPAYAAPEQWFRPIDGDTPTGCKLLLLDSGGCCVIGRLPWAGMIGWAPLPKIPDSMKR